MKAAASTADGTDYYCGYLSLAITFARRHHFHSQYQVRAGREPYSSPKKKSSETPRLFTGKLSACLGAAFMSENRIRFYEFGPFRLDVAERQLWRDGDEITVTPKAFGVLLTLVRNHGHVVEKDTFMSDVWAESFVEEKNLTDNISILRQALIDDPKEPRYIKTVPRR